MHRGARPGERLIDAACGCMHAPAGPAGGGGARRHRRAAIAHRLLLRHIAHIYNSPVAADRQQDAGDQVRSGAARSAPVQAPPRWSGRLPETSIASSATRRRVHTSSSAYASLRVAHTRPQVRCACHSHIRDARGRRPRWRLHEGPALQLRRRRHACPPRRPPSALQRLSARRGMLVVRAATVSSNDFKTGMTIEFDGAPYKVVGE